MLQKLQSDNDDLMEIFQQHYDLRQSIRESDDLFFVHEPPCQSAMMSVCWKSEASDANKNIMS